ncbi:hypothetical protein BH11MYX1_BH11MYX1_23060 [soil metagenome]
MRRALTLAVLVGCGPAPSHVDGGDDEGTTDASSPLVPPQGCDAQDDDGDDAEAYIIAATLSIVVQY